MTWLNLMKLKEAAGGVWLDTMNGGGKAQLNATIRAATAAKAVVIIITTQRKTSACMVMKVEELSAKHKLFFAELINCGLTLFCYDILVSFSLIHVLG